MDSIIKLISVNFISIPTLIVGALVLFLTISCLNLALKVVYYRLHGIYGPLPLPIIGNLIEMTFKPRAELEIKWREKYGKIYVTFVGTNPRLMIADPQILRDICITNFKHFTDTNFASTTSRFEDNSLFYLKGNRWRKVRSLMTPTFTSGKIKQMFESLQTTSNDLVAMIKESFTSSREALTMSNKSENNETKIESKLQTKVSSDIFHMFALKSIALCCYAIDVNRNGLTKVKDICDKSEFVNACVQLDYFPFWSQVIGLLLPASIIPLFTSHFKRRFAHLVHLENHMKSMLKLREGKHSKHNDILSNLYTARLGDKLEFINNSEKDLESHHEGYTGKESLTQVYNEMNASIDSNKSQLGFQLTNNELYANSVLMLSVGTNTSKDMLQTVIYCLAFHKNIQDRLYDELIIFRNVDNFGKSRFEYEKLISNQYLDAFLSEVLRLFGAVIFSNRKCTEDYLLKEKNFVIKKGDVIHIGIHSLQTDPDYWTEPEKFDPERFMPGNKEKIVPGSYCPFGLGPRQCVGMRFALTEIKLGIAKLVTEFEFFPIKGSAFPPTESYSSFLRVLNDQSVNAKSRGDI